ncbi:polycystin family receptor for egg jelly-like [Mytilus californianus]|uniref:polycystin family receptor for egg jelly-like n=1 Tax=Mytilus californianus TaxID=6549 RepID=UPI00224640E9|nr:polycystin family receptor for egg jelly-like [Mytilus californianus]
MFYLNIKENLADNHMWVSIFFRPTSSHYTRCQRLTCFLLFIFLTMIGNAIYFRDEDEFSNAGSDIRVGPFSFSLSAIYIALISALISTPATVFVILMFSKSKHRKNNTKDSSRRYRVPVLDFWLDRLMADSHKLEKALVSKELFKIESTIFPYWFQYIAWILALTGIAACSVFLTLYSVEWGEKKSVKWLGQFFLSFFSSICLLDPLKITHVTDYIKWLRYTAFPELYPETDYTGERLHWRLRQYFNDLTSLRVGPPRLRQLRVTECEMSATELRLALGSPDLDYSVTLQVEISDIYGDYVTEEMIVKVHLIIT